MKLSDQMVLLKGIAVFYYHPLYNECGKTDFPDTLEKRL
jgi:hypothetical protein